MAEVRRLLALILFLALTGCERYMGELPYCPHHSTPHYYYGYGHGHGGHR